MERKAAVVPTQPLFTLYYWRYGFVLLAPSFVLDRNQNPYRRLSATFMYASKAPFVLETGAADTLTTRAALIGPKVPRRRLRAVHSQLLICDLSVATPEFNALRSLLGNRPVQALDEAAFTAAQADIDRMHAGELLPEELQPCIRGLVEALSGQKIASLQLDPRIALALELIDEHPMYEVTLTWLAGKVHLSPSRLRHLFTEQVGCSLTHYLRWTAIMKGAWLWSRGMPLADINAHVGFHDLAHANHVFNELFGLNPSLLANPDMVRLFRCDWQR